MDDLLQAMMGAAEALLPQLSQAQVTQGLALVAAKHAKPGSAALQAMLVRQVAQDAHKIKFKIAGNKVRLTGSVTLDTLRRGTLWSQPVLDLETELLATLS